MASIPPPMIPSPESIRKRKTIVQGEWYLDIKPSDFGILYVARNNEYETLLGIVKNRSSIFNALFGCFIDRLTRAKKRHQKFIDNKNSAYFHAEQVIDII